MSNPVIDWFKNQFHPVQSPQLAAPCFWQTDVHSHLIPAIDDGVKSLEEATSCIQQLADWGIQKVITTPHISADYYPNQVATLQAGRDSLQQQVDLAGIGVRIEVAAEYMLDERFLNRLEEAPLLGFGAENYLLIETGWLARPLLLDEMIFRIQTHGYTPVLAHPERYPYYWQDPEGLTRLRDQGCLMQLNWMSLTGRYGSQARTQAKMVLKNKWADFIGSDCHRPGDMSALGSLFATSTYALLQEQPLRNSLL